MSGAPPLLCIPGSLCDERLFAPMLSLLSRAAVCAPPIDQTTCAAAAQAILSDMPERFIAVGFSLGGFVALELLRRAPRRTTAVALLSSHAHPDLIEAADDRRAMAALARSAGPEAVVDKLWPRSLAPSALSDDDLLGRLREMARDVGAERFARQVELNVARPDNRDLVAQTVAPILVVHGTEDRLCPADYAVSTAAQAPRGSLERLPGVGHFAPLEAPAAVAKALEDWMGGLEGAAPGLQAGAGAGSGG